jgi:hypothetical protein
MTTNLSASSSTVNAAKARRNLAASLMRDWQRRQVASSQDHADGMHVGMDGDDIGCGACLYSGDYPKDHPLTRDELLERNIALAVEIMRCRADISRMEFPSAA